MEQEKKIITDWIDESQSNEDVLTEVASESKPSTVTRTIDKTTYVVGLHFKEQALTFSEVLKRVLKGAGSEKYHKKVQKIIDNLFWD